MPSIPHMILKYIPLTIIDLLIFLLVYPSGFLLKAIRIVGIKDLPLCKNALISVGVFPIRNHYYEPLFDMRDLKRPLSDNRVLPGIDWNTEVQLAVLEDFNFNKELLEFPKKKENDLTFHYDNDFFGPGDAEHWYNIVRKFKPNRIFEIGSGNSTLLAAAAIRKNKQESSEYACKHVCIEPYENPWLEEIDVTVVREKVEDLDTGFFSELGENDILFM